jgi:hypothetical protein
VTWSAATKVTTAQTDETVSGADLGNQYGDYNGLSGHAGRFFPSWTDRRSGAREEIWTAPITTAQPPRWLWADQGSPLRQTVDLAMSAITVQDAPGAAQRPYAFVRAADGHLWVNWWTG